jgi:large subunit ribosomal protein L5
MSAVLTRSAPQLRLRERYDKQIVPALLQRFAYANAMQVPRLVKVVVNIGVGESIQNPKALDAAVADLKKITGQQPIVLRSRKAIANFKLRAGLPIGVKVTLRGARMYQFLDKLISVALPRIRDFRGIPPNAFDGQGNYTLGLREQLVFPEIEYDKIDKLRGLEVTVAQSQSWLRNRQFFGGCGGPARCSVTTAATSAAGHGPTCASSGFAGSASARWPRWDRCRE